MINKHSIYNWLFFPLLASLLAGSAASCINDPAMEEDTSGKSTLSIMVRGVTTDPADGYDEYIQTLRIVGFDASGKVVCNQLFDHDVNTANIPDFIIQGTGEDTKINIIQTLKEAFQGGTCNFYFIANENGYTVYNTQSSTQSLSNFLDEVSLDGLKSCIIAYDGKEPGATNQRSILMTTSVTSALKPGDNTINDIELVRCFAKVQLKVTNQSSDNITLSNATLTGKYPDSFHLLNEGNYMANVSTEFSTLLQTGNITISAGNTVEVGELYFPEWLSQTDVNLKYSFNLSDGISNKTYEFPAVDNNITRNTCYITTATFAGWESVSIRLDVDPWEVVSSEIHWNTTPQFALNVNKSAVGTDEKKYYPITYTATNDPNDTNDLVFMFSITEPLGSAWVFSLSNGSDFYFVDPDDADNYKYVPNGIVGTDSKNLTIRLRAKNSYNADTPQETMLAVKYQMADGTWNRLIIDAEQATGNSRDVFLIRQIPAN